MKLTKEQKTELAQKLNNPWGHVRLTCDGYRVDLQVQSYKGLTYRVMTFVNGEFKGLWVSSEHEHPEQKFLRKFVKPLYSSAQKAKLEKIYGKRAFAKEERFHQKITCYLPDFATGKAAISHLCKVCESIEIVEA